MQIPCLFVLLRNTVSFPNIDGLLQQNHLDSSGKRYYLGIWVFVSYWFICLQRICTTMHFLKLRNKLVWLSLPFLKVGCIQGDPTRLSQVICFWWGQKFQKTFRTEKSNNKVTALRVSPQSMIPKTVKISLWSEETKFFWQCSLGKKQPFLKFISQLIPIRLQIFDNFQNLRWKLLYLAVT